MVSLPVTRAAVLTLHGPFNPCCTPERPLRQYTVYSLIQCRGPTVCLYDLVPYGLQPESCMRVIIVMVVSSFSRKDPVKC